MRAGNERGATAVMFALMATMMLGVGAIAVDIGQVYAARASVQDAADKAAVAAAAFVDGRSTCPAEAVAEAKKYLSANWPTIAGNDRSSTSSIALDGTTAGGKIECTNDWKVRVTAPAVQVDFGLAQAITDRTSADVAATAEAGVFSPGNTKVMPAYTTGSPTCTYGSHILFHGPTGLVGELGSDPLCALGMGNFGGLKLPRRINSNENAELAANIARGPDFTLSRHPIQTYTTCGSGSSDVVSTKFVLKPGTNCVDTLRGNRANAAEDGFILGVTEGGTSYPGLLDAPTSDQCKSGLLSGVVPGLLGRDDLTIGGKRVNNDRLECYLKVNLDLNALGEGYAGPVVLDPKVLDSPRFVWVPVISALPPCLLPLVCAIDDDSVTNGDGFYKVMTFRPGFIQGPLGVFGPKVCVLTQCSYNGIHTDKKDDLLTVRVFLFSDRALPESITFDTTREYLGVGPRVIRLTD